MLFSRHKTVDLKKLSQTLQTKSRMSIFRRLKAHGYLSSFTHTGRFYTLADVAQFDNYGLWFHQGIGFSQYGTLKATIAELVNSAEAGHTHTELKHILRIQAHNTLLTLLKESRLGRERLNNTFLYVSAKPEKAADQIFKRRKLSAIPSQKIDPIPVATIIEVLIEAIHAGKISIRPALIAKQLAVRGVPVTVKQVEQIFIQYAISTEKKTV